METRFKVKSFLLGLFVLVFLLFLVACGGNEKSSGKSTDDSVDNDQLKAAFVTAQKVGDQGPVDMAYSGFEKGTEEFGIKGQLIEVEKGEYEESIRAMAQDGYELIIAVFPELQDAVERVASEFPDTEFVMVIGEIDAPNVRSVLQKEQEAGYLAGILASSMTETNQIAFLGGNDNPQINRWFAGYQQGAKEVNPDVKVINAYVGDFEDPTKGKEIALSLYNDGVDYIFHAAAKSGLGLLDAAKEVDKYVIGGSFNQNDLVPGNVPGSAVEYYDKMSYDALQDLAEGNPIGGQVEYGGIKEERLDLVLAPKDLVDIPEDLVNKIDAYRQKIIDGEIEINETPVK